MLPISVNDFVDTDTQTPVMLAAYAGDEEALRALLFEREGPHFIRNKVSLFDADSNGRTALFYAAELGEEGMVWALLRLLPGTGLGCGRGYLLDHRDNDGRLAEEWASLQGHDEIASLLSGERLRIEYYE